MKELQNYEKSYTNHAFTPYKETIMKMAQFQGIKSKNFQIIPSNEGLHYIAKKSLQCNRAKILKNHICV